MSYLTAQQARDRYEAAQIDPLTEILAEIEKVCDSQWRLKIKRHLDDYLISRLEEMGYIVYECSRNLEESMPFLSFRIQIDL